MLDTREVSDLKLNKNFTATAKATRLGQRLKTISDNKRGVYFNSRIPKDEKIHDIAFDATLRAVALRMIKNKNKSRQFQIQKEDYVKKTGTPKPLHLSSSLSMQVDQWLL